MPAARSLCIGMLFAGLAGCAVGPNYHEPKPTTPGEFVALGEAGRQTAAAARPVVDLNRWWQSLDDPELDSLIDRAIGANPDIEIALTRLQELRTGQAV